MAIDVWQSRSVNQQLTLLSALTSRRPREKEDDSFLPSLLRVLEDGYGAMLDRIKCILFYVAYAADAAFFTRSHRGNSISSIETFDNNFPGC